MIALDTNVLVRFFIRDDQRAYAMAEALLVEGPVVVTAAVLLEAYWVLRSVYKMPKREILEAFSALLTLPSVEAIDGDAAEVALGWSHAGLDFADAVHLAQSRPADVFASFDIALAKRAARLSNTPVVSHPKNLIR